ncbi:recombinase family protein [Saccharopolyspora sp. NPDC049426]|uniref:recombinase family protein n=1 Tax=Saccharopolyspora sp. NPDC049426 TaxID=3155652 RepID=UPI00341894BF
MLNEGRHQGGRAPYGYKVVDAGPHPNPSRAADGYRLKVLAIDNEVVDVVRWIFAEYLSGRGDRAIANGLNRDGFPCPSARRAEQNRHRLAEAVLKGVAAHSMCWGKTGPAAACWKACRNDPGTLATGS